MKRKSPLLLVPLAAVLASFLFTVSDQKSMAALRDPLSILQDRSPGERQAGALFNTKPKRKPVASERVLPLVRERPAPLEEAPYNLIVPPATPPQFEQGSLAPEFGLIDEPGFTIPPETFPAPPPSIRPYPVGHGGTIIDRVPSAPVPEPSTWAVMILGFFGIGAALRRNQRNARRAKRVRSAPSC